MGDLDLIHSDRLKFTKNPRKKVAILKFQNSDRYDLLPVQTGELFRPNQVKDFQTLSKHYQDQEDVLKHQLSLGEKLTYYEMDNVQVVKISSLVKDIYVKTHKNL